MSEWQPIESAPTDGTEIIGFWQGTAKPGYCIITWDGHVARHHKWKRAFPITHWMPLPAPPTPPRGEGS